MSNHVVQSNDSDGMSRQSMNPNKSSWMAHWMQTSYKSSPQACDHLSLRYKSKEEEDDHDVKQRSLSGEREISFGISKSGKGFREVAETSPVKILNENMRSSNNSKKEGKDSHSFPIFNLSQNRESILGSKNDQLSICSKKVLRSPVDHNSRYDIVTLATNESHLPSPPSLDPPETEKSLRGCHYQTEGTSENFGQLVKYQNFLDNNRFAASSSFQGDFVGSTSNVMHGFSSEKSPMQSFMCRPEQFNQLDSRLPLKEHFQSTILTHLEHERENYHNFSALLVRNSHLKPKTSATSLLRQNDGPLALHYPSTSNYQVPNLFGEPYQKMQKHSDMRFFTSQSRLPEVNKSENLNHGFYSQQKMPLSVHDVETMRLRTTVDSVEGISGGTPTYSQTTRHMLITTKTGVNLSEGGQMFRESAVSKKFRGKTVCELLDLSPAFGSHGQPGLKLQPLDSFTDSEGNEKIGDVKISAVDSKNESSAETDIMDMDAFKENYHLPDLALSLYNKGGEYVSSSQLKLSSNNEEVSRRLPSTELPDINEEPPAQFAAANPMGDGVPSTSKTQSLDVDHLLSNAGNPSSSKSIFSPIDILGPTPSSRWVKRLKLSTPGSLAHGTKSSKMGEASSHEKVNKFLQILKGSITSTEPSSDTHHGREQMALNQIAVSLKNGESSVSPSAEDSVKRGEDITLSHSWVRRWCHSQVASPQKKPEAVIVCEPRSSKAALEDFHKEQFPSIAAMALMGKAMNGFRPCEFRKRGSFVVWNTKEL